MSKTPWIKWYPGDFLNGIADLSPHEIALYTVILCRIYDEDGPVKNDINKFARRCNMRVDRCKKTLNLLFENGKLTLNNDEIDNFRAQIERKKRQKMSERQSGNRLKTVPVGSEKPNENNGNGQPEHNQTPTKHEPNGDLLEPEPELERLKKTKAKKRACQIPDDWVVTDNHKKIAADCGYSPNERLGIAIHFVDYWKSNGGTKVDWDRTFNNWIRSPITAEQVKKFRTINGGGNKTIKEVFDQFDVNVLGQEGCENG